MAKPTLDDALEIQRGTLFDAQAIIDAVANGLRESFGEEMDSADHPAPGYDRALRMASRLIGDACDQLDEASLRERRAES